MLLGETGYSKEKKMSEVFSQDLEISALSATSPSVVVVCVEKNSKDTVKWALNDLVGEELTLIHVTHPIVAIPTPMGNIPIAHTSNDVVTAYMETVASETRNMLWPFQQMCNSKKVQAETIVLEDHDVSKAILEYISNSKIKIRKLVVGSSNNLIRKLKGRDTSTLIAKQASKFCDVYVIAKGKLVSVHPSNTSEYALPPTEMTGQRVLVRSESNISDRNGSQRFEKNISNFEGAIVSKVSKSNFSSGSLVRNKSVSYIMKTTAPEMETAAKYKEVSLKLGKLEDTKDAFDQIFKRYSIDEIMWATDFFAESLKIGEGGYGSVYKGSLDHTTVAIKILQADTAKGRDKFQREIKILSRIHHPNMVMLLGACPERRCLVYEYMENGSLEDRLFHRGERDSLPWFIRFRIASEIATALHFLHTTKPEPIIHCDLKPANILIDHNFVSKIGDLGLSKLIPPPGSCTVTEFRIKVLAGNDYLDPEYVRTRTLFPASDVYALGIIFLQLLTAKSPMGIIDDVQEAIEEGSFKEILDKTAGEWPLEETEEFAKLALKCTELRRRDRPDMNTVILPKLERFKDLKDAYDEDCTF